MSLASQLHDLSVRSASMRAELYPTDVKIISTGVVITVPMTAVRSGRQLVEGGFELDHDAIMRIPTALAITPTLGMEFLRLKDSQKLKVAEVKSPGSGGEWVLGLKQL